MTAPFIEEFVRKLENCGLTIEWFEAESMMRQIIRRRIPFGHGIFIRNMLGLAIGAFCSSNTNMLSRKLRQSMDNLSTGPTVHLFCCLRKHVRALFVNLQQIVGLALKVTNKLAMPLELEIAIDSDVILFTADFDEIQFLVTDVERGGKNIKRIHDYRQPIAFLVISPFIEEITINYKNT